MDTTQSKNKLVRSLTEEQLAEFLEELVKTPGVDGPMIQEQALAKFGISIGHESANGFRKDVFGRYIDRLRKRKALSETIAAHRDSSTGRTLADAASEELQQQVFEFLADNPVLDLSDKDDLKRAESLSRIIKSARSEDRRMIEQLTEELKEAREREKETKAALGDKTLTEQQRAVRMMELFGITPS